MTNAPPMPSNDEWKTGGRGFLSSLVGAFDSIRHSQPVGHSSFCYDRTVGVRGADQRGLGRVLVGPPVAVPGGVVPQGELIEPFAGRGRVAAGDAGPAELLLGQVD